VGFRGATLPRCLSMTSPLDALNPEQRDAVTTTEGPLLVLAGAGTGKTRVITSRIAHLLSKKVKPEAILAMTFTNKAAGEMRARVAKLVGKKRAERLTIGTFHAFCLATLREECARLGWAKGFTICDAADQRSTLKKVLRELHVAEATLQPGLLQSKISLLKNKRVDPSAFLESAKDSEDELIGRAWRRYNDVLGGTRRVDFDDLLVKTGELLRDHPDLRKAFEERYRYVLVDEYQDTNGAQYEIVKLIAGGHRNLCVVGDDDQSIYGWRGADVGKILSFDRDFHGAKVVKLETNYRSTRSILGVANRLIRNNTGRHEKTLRSALTSGEDVQAVVMRDEDYEAEYIVREIGQLVGDGRAHKDFAILFRTAVQSRSFEAELRAKDIPYVLVGGMSFFDRKEVRDIVAYLRLVANPLDESSLLRIINCPPRGIGKVTIERVLAYATELGVSVCEAFGRVNEIEGVNPDTSAAVQRLLERLTALEPGFKEDLVGSTRRLIEEVAYRGEVDRIYPDEKTRNDRWAAVEEVLNFAENFKRRHPRRGLGAFLNQLALSTDDTADAEDAQKRSAVTLMTLHASKGLEFPRVYLIGLEEGLLPHTRSVAEDSIEEERRLAYVGVTRAREALTLTYTAERSKYGKRVRSHPSRFLFEIKDVPPPADWVPTGGADAPEKGAAKKKKKRRAKRKRASRTKF
jgi:DNA helicase-2/ATP-dependent DNA helicase PcrA